MTHRGIQNSQNIMSSQPNSKIQIVVASPSSRRSRRSSNIQLQFTLSIHL